MTTWRPMSFAGSYAERMPENTLRCSVPRSSVSCSSLSEPSTVFASSTVATRRSSLAKSLMLTAERRRAARARRCGHGLCSSWRAWRRPSRARRVGRDELCHDLRDRDAARAARKRRSDDRAAASRPNSRSANEMRRNFPGLLRHLRHDRREVAHEHAEQVDALRADGEHLGGLRRILRERPGLVRVDVLIGAIGETHDAAHRRGVLARLVELARSCRAAPRTPRTAPGRVVRPRACRRRAARNPRSGSRCSRACRRCPSSRARRNPRATGRCRRRPGRACSRSRSAAVRAAGVRGNCRAVMNVPRDFDIFAPLIVRKPCTNTPVGLRQPEPCSTAGQNRLWK